MARIEHRKQIQKNIRGRTIHLGTVTSTRLYGWNRAWMGTTEDTENPYLEAEPRDTRRMHRYSELIFARNSLLALVLPILSTSSSMASTGESGFSTRRKTQMRVRSSFGISSSSFRVPER